MSESLYDTIGRRYATTRRPDPRIAAAIAAAIGDARSVVNVGAGTGSYEPADRWVIAVEPSRRMIQQRVSTAAQCVQASSEALPFRDQSFEAALASLTVHHWSDWQTGIRELKRVARRIVIFTFDPREVGRFWLTERYFPEITALDRSRAPSIEDISGLIGPCRVEPVLIPHDCADGFLAAYWRRPEVYLDASVRASISGFAMLDPDLVERGVARLRSDLESGEWDSRYGYLRTLEALDICYRLLTAE